jgi:hypothetical protein
MEEGGVWAKGTHGMGPYSSLMAWSPTRQRYDLLAPCAPPQLTQRTRLPSSSSTIMSSQGAGSLPTQPLRLMQPLRPAPSANANACGGGLLALSASILFYSILFHSIIF